MKKILIIILVFAGKLSYGQYPNSHIYSNARTIETPRGAMNPLLGFIPPLADTLNNINVTYVGAYTTRPQDSKPYYSDGTKWIAFGSGGGSSGLTFPTVPHKYLTGYDDLFGTLNTDSITEATNLFFTTARARISIGVTRGLTYDTTSGILKADTSVLTTKRYVDSASATAWNILGNAGTTSGTNFIGTTDNVALKFRVNNRPYGFLDNNLSTGNMGFGDGVLTSITSGTFNVAFGYSALLANTSGNSNAAFGSSALISNTTGSSNIAMGSNALTSNTTGSNNTALGGSALKVNTTASYSTAVGARALFNSTGQRNTAVGQSALEGIVAGVNNTAIGENTRLFNNGSYNTFIGHSAGYNSANDSSVFIGYQAGYNSTGTGKLYIANSSGSTPLIYGSFGSAVNTTPYLAINAGATADTATAVLSIRSTTKGVLFPRMSSAQMRGIAGAPVGLLVYCNDSSAICIKISGTDTAWRKLSQSSGGGGGGGGTVTDVMTGYGLSGGTITSSGTLILDTAAMFASAGGPVRKTDSVNAITGYTSLYKNSLKQNAISVTTTGTSGAATLVGATLNIPIYGSGSGSPNSNLGSGYRLARQALPTDNTIKTLATVLATGIIIDSSTTANSITIKADTSKLVTTFRIQDQINDSLNANQLVIDNTNGVDSFVNFVTPDTLRFKLPKGSSPIVITTFEDSIRWSMPSFQPIPSSKVLTINKTMTLTAASDGVTYTMPTAVAAANIATTSAITQEFLGDVTLSTTGTANVQMGKMRSGLTNAASNIVWQNAAGISNQTSAPSVPSGVPGISYRVNFAGSNSTATSNYGYSNINIGQVSFQTGSSGEQPYATNLMVQSPVDDNNGASRVSTLSNVEIRGKPSFGNADTAVSLMVRGSMMVTDTASFQNVNINSSLAVNKAAGGNTTLNYFASAGLTTSSGTQNLVALFPTINQSSTAGYRALWVSAQETAVGSGTKSLIDAGTSSGANGSGFTSMFAVSDKGKITLSTATNGSAGIATLSGGTVTVSNTSVTASSKIFFSYRLSPSGTLGQLQQGTIVAGTSFVINSLDATGSLTANNSSVNWWIIN